MMPGTKGYRWALGTGVLSVALLPLGARADAFVPVLLAVGFVSFLYGIAGIILLEALVLRYLFRVPSLWTAIRDSAVANALSGLVGGVLYPAAVGALTYFVAPLVPPAARQLVLAIGTWPTVAQSHGRLVAWSSLGWLVLSYVASVAVEGAVLRRRWNRIGGPSPASALRAAAFANTVSYPFLIGLTLLLWKDIFFP